MKRLIVGGGHADGYPRPRPHDVTLDIDPDAQPDIVADVASLPLPDESFDEVVGEYLPYPAFTSAGAAGLREMIRTVRVGGRVVVDTGFGMPAESLAPVLQMGSGRLRLSTRGGAWRITYQRDAASAGGVRVSGRIPAGHLPIRSVDPSTLSHRAADGWRSPAGAALAPAMAPFVRGLVAYTLELYGSELDPARVTTAVRRHLRALAHIPRVTLGAVITSDVHGLALQEREQDPYHQAAVPLARVLGADVAERPLAIAAGDADQLDRLAALTGRTQGDVLAEGIAVAGMLRLASDGAAVRSRGPRGAHNDRDLRSRALAALTPLTVARSSMRRVPVASHVRADLNSLARSLGSSSASAAGVAVASLTLVDGETREGHTVTVGTGRGKRVLRRPEGALRRETTMLAGIG